MLNINRHPTLQNIGFLKKQGHFLRFFLAGRFAKGLGYGRFVGIVGSVGKTTTTIACKEVLSSSLKVISSTDTNKEKPNLDPVFNIPLTILRAGKSIDKILLEMGIEYPGEMDFYLKLVSPKTIIVTRLTLEHSQYLGDLEKVIQEESKAVEALPSDGYAILNWDDINCRKLADKTKAQIVFYGTDGKNCHVWADKITIENFSTSFELNCGVERVEIQSQVLGKHQIYPLLAAAALGVTLDIPLTGIKKSLEKVKSPAHRLHAQAGFNGSIILDDSYNAQPVSVEEALNTLSQVSAKRRILVMGEMRELGEFSENIHRDVARKIYKDDVDLVFMGKGDAKYIQDELLKLGFNKKKLEADLQNPQIVSKLLKILGKGDVVLVKGSRAAKLDEVVLKLVRGDG